MPQLKLFSSIVFFVVITLSSIKAQCELEPTISGYFFICPDQPTQIMTEEYDSVQWFYRSVFEEFPEAIPGANSTILNIEPPNYSSGYYSVEVFEEDCTGTSIEELIIEVAFPPLQVTATTTNPPNDLSICPGDTIFLDLDDFNTDTLVTWYKDGELIEDVIGSNLAITEPGSYFVQTVSLFCIESEVPELSATIEITERENCITTTQSIDLDRAIQVGPNPAHDNINVNLPEQLLLERYQIWNSAGKLMMYKAQINDSHLAINVAELASGIYFLALNIGGKTVWKRIVKQ